jgi:hypothetical protein
MCRKFTSAHRTRVIQNPSADFGIDIAILQVDVSTLALKWVQDVDVVLEATQFATIRSPVDYDGATSYPTQI